MTPWMARMTRRWDSVEHRFQTGRTCQLCRRVAGQRMRAGIERTSIQQDLSREFSIGTLVLLAFLVMLKTP